MEGNLSSGNMNPGGPVFGGLDLQGPMGLNHHQHPHGLQQQHLPQPQQGLVSRASMCEAFPLTMGKSKECEHHNSMRDYDQSEKGKHLPSDEDEHNFNEEMDGQSEVNHGNKVSIWRRVKWTDSMIRLLITALSYIGEDAASDGCHGGRRKQFNLQKKGKWKLISKVMAERGFYVSPQQCEDKFNDLNKRYKKLNDILGRGTSCQVVENPPLLDMMDHLSEKAKDEVRKILSSKHLFYEEMCSYHNGNRLHLPHDPALQRSLQLALRSKDDQDIDSRRHSHDDDEDDHDAETDDHEEYEENHGRSVYGVHGDSAKRIKQGQGLEDFSFGNPHSMTLDFNRVLELQSPHANMHPTLPDGQKAARQQNLWQKSRALQLEEQKLQIELEMLDLEKQRLKWQRFSKKKDRELEKLRMENDRMRLENERMALKLKQMELAMKCHQ